MNYTDFYTGGECPANDMGNGPCHLPDIPYDMFYITAHPCQYETYHVEMQAETTSQGKWWPHNQDRWALTMCVPVQKGQLCFTGENVITYVSLQLRMQNAVSAQPCVEKLGISLVLLNFLGCNFRLWFETP